MFIDRFGRQTWFEVALETNGFDFYAEEFVEFVSSEEWSVFMRVSGLQVNLFNFLLFFL